MVLAHILMCLFTVVTATSDDSKACQAWDVLMAAWGSGNYSAAAATMADGVEVTYGKTMALATPGLTDFGTQKLNHTEATEFLKNVAEVYDFYSVGNYAA